MVDDPAQRLARRPLRLATGRLQHIALTAALFLGQGRQAHERDLVGALQVVAVLRAGYPVAASPTPAMWKLSAVATCCVISRILRTSG